MCLIYNEGLTDAVRKQLNKTKELTGYKVLLAYPRAGLATELSSRYRFAPYLPGVIKSDRPFKGLTSVEKQTKRIDRGIHVYLKESEARKKFNNDFMYSKNELRLVPVACYARDFVAAGSFDSREASAVFTKVSFRKKDYLVAFGRVPKKDATKKPVKAAAKLSSRAAMLSARAKKAWETRRANGWKPSTKKRSS